MKAFVLLLRYSGLRIRDAATLARERLKGTKLFLYTQKTGTPVFVEKGVPLETVSVLLGHSSVKVTEKHYRPWVKSLQQNLETAVRKAW